MINILFFAKYRELLGTEHLSLASNDFQNIKQLSLHLSTKGKNWEAVFTTPQLMVAVNQNMATLETEIKSGDEIAFFPPVTGG